MQYIARSVPPPAILTGSAAQMYRDGAARFMRQSGEKISQHPLMHSSLNLAHDSMSKALEQLFQGRCAFCEAEVPTQAYRLRPFTEALPYQASNFAHLYYIWMDAAWQNFYAICSSCLPPNAEYFPVIGKRAPVPTMAQFDQYAREGTGLWPDYPLKEKPVLLDPCLDRHLHKHIDVQGDGRLIGINERGMVTIEHFSLNADLRVRQRAEAYGYYFEDLLQWVCYPEREVPAPFPDRADMQFTGSWYLLLRRLAIRVAAETGLPVVLSRRRIYRVFKSLRKLKSPQEMLRACWHEVATEKLKPYSAVPTHPPRTDAPTLTRVYIKSFKTIESLDFILPDKHATPEENKPDTPSLLILGENAVGKSTILEAIALALSSDTAVQELNLRADDLVLDPFQLGSKKTQKALAARIEIELTDQSKRILDITPDGIHSSEARRLPLIPVFAYGAFRRYQSGTAPTSQNFIHNLFDAGVLANPESWLRGLEPDQFAMVIRALSHIFSIDEKFEVVRWNPDREQFFVITAFDDKERVLAQSSLNAASSGFRSVLAMVCDIMRGLMDRDLNPNFQTLNSARAVVLIDEVEAHLHPRWKMQIMRGLRNALPKVTFIVTTHDPLCLRGMNDDENRLLRRVQVNKRTASGLCMRVEMVPDLPPASELRVEQLLTSELFQLYSTDDPEMENRFAQVADLLALEKRDDEQQAIVERFRDDVVSALPIGTSEAHRVVQEAVAGYLKKRRDQADKKRKALREAVKQDIINALQRLL